MKIESLDIAAFGKFKNYHLDLSDGFTVLYGENEAGKTTLMAFIRMMFYGNTGKSTDLAKHPRKKYRPWNSDVMAGSITFSHGSYRYRLEREFKGSNSTDKITLIDLDTGSTQNLSGSDDIGAKFFGLTDAAFERSVFIDAGVVTTQNEAAQGELGVRLSNITTTADEDTSFEKIKLRLSKAKETLFAKRGKAGISDKVSAELQTTEETLALATRKEEEIALLTQKADLLEAELKANSAESTRLFDMLKNADKMKKRIFVEKFLHGLAETEELDKKLTLSDGTSVDSVFMTTAKVLCDRAETAEEKLTNLRSELKLLDDGLTSLKGSVVEPSFDNKADLLVAEKEDTERRLEEERNNSMRLNAQLECLKPTKKLNLPLLIVGLIVAAAGVGLFASSLLIPAVSLAIGGAGLLLAILGIVLKKTVPPDDGELKAELLENTRLISSLVDKKQSLAEKIAAINSAAEKQKLELAGKQALIDSKEEEFSRKNALYAEATAHFNECIAALSSHLGSIEKIGGVAEAVALINNLEQLIILRDNSATKLTPLADHAGCKTREEAEAKLAVMDAEGVAADLTERELDLIKEKFKAQSDITAKNRSELASLKAEIKAAADSVPSVAVLELKKAELESRIAAHKDFADTVDLAAEVLEEAFRELRKNYSGALEQKTAEIFSKLTGGKYNTVNVSKDFELSVSGSEAFGLKESAFLSSGTEDQLYLALRLALAELITAESETLPIFMDDPLADYDDRRAEIALSFMKEYSADKQLIMFTCHKGFSDTAEKLSANLKNLQEV